MNALDKKIITIGVYGGMIQWIQGIPEDVRIVVRDYDIEGAGPDDLSHDEAGHVADVVRRTNADGVSLIVVDHNMRFMSRLCHRIVVLHHGTELATGTPEQITRDPRVIEAYLGTSHAPA